MLVPLNLLPLYTYPRDISPLSLNYFLPVLLAAGITMACVIAIKKQKMWIAVWGYYVVTLIPVLGIVQVGGQAMADRYTYLPGIGPFLLVGLATAWSWERLGRLKRGELAIKSAVAVAAFFVFACAAYITVRQTGIWKNSIDLWSYVIEKEPVKVNLAYYMRGLVYQQQEYLDKALSDYNMVNALEPFHYEVYSSLGSIHEKMGQPDKAIEDYSMSIAINPRAFEVFVSRGVLYGKTGWFDKAAEDFSKAIELDQNDATVYLRRGSLYLKTGKRELAASDYSKACSLGHHAGCDALRAL